MHVFGSDPHNTRHLNALYLPQFLSHSSLKTSHTPTFKPTAGHRPPCCDVTIRGYNCRVS